MEHGRLRVPFVATAENVADFFTKPLMGKDFFRRALAVRDKVMERPTGRFFSSVTFLTVGSKGGGVLRLLSCVPVW